MTGIRVKIKEANAHKNGVLVTFAWKGKDGPWSEETLNFSKANTKNEILAELKRHVVARIAENSVEPPDLTAEIGHEKALEDWPDHRPPQANPEAKSAEA
jgi:hypothetical protein